MRSVNRAYRQSKKLQELASALAVDDLGPDLEDPGFEEAADLPPQLAEDCRGANLGAWLASRITEVEKRTAYCPRTRSTPSDGHCQLGLLLAELPHAQLPWIPVSP